MVERTQVGWIHGVPQAGPSVCVNSIHQYQLHRYDLRQSVVYEYHRSISVAYL